MDKPKKPTTVYLNPNMNAVLKEVLVQHLKKHRISVTKAEDDAFPYQKPCPVRDTKLKE